MNAVLAGKQGESFSAEGLFLSEHPRSPSEGLVRWVEFYVFTSVCYYRPPVGLSSREGWVYEVLLELDVFMIVRVTAKSDL